MRKKSFLAVLFILGVISFAQSQVNERSIGVRFGYGGEVSYQQPLTDNTRAEIDLGIYGFGNSSFVITGVHQWLFEPTGGFNLFAGVGPQVGSFYYRDNNNNSQHGLGIAVAGQIGAEYNLDEIPLQFSLDWRPSVNLIPSSGSFGYQGFALGIRYRF